MTSSSTQSNGPAPSAVIEEITALGPFFALRTHPAGAAPGEPWQRMDGPLIEARVAAVGEWLAAAGGREAGAIEPRVAASVAHLGLAARLVSPALAAAVLHGRLLTYGLGDLRWQPVLGGPVPLSLPADAVRDVRTPPEQLADVLGRDLLAGPLEELAGLFGEFGVSPHILRGNTASAVNGAVTMIVQARPELAVATRDFAALLLNTPPLQGESAVVEGAFRRRSCCLIYRAAPGGKGALCGDCALR